MDNLKNQLIKLGSENRGLRPHLKEILNHVTKTAKKDTDELLARNNETTEDVLDGFEKYLLYRNLKPSGGWRYDGENRGFVIYKMRGNKPTKWSAELQFDGVYVKPAIFFENEENGKMQGMRVPGGIFMYVTGLYKKGWKKFFNYYLNWIFRKYWGKGDYYYDKYMRN